VRVAKVTFRAPGKSGTPRDELKLGMRLSLLHLDSGLIASQTRIAVHVGDTLCVESLPGDGGRWSRLQKRPWTWKGVLRGTPGCAGAGRVKLDLRSGALSVRLRKVALATVRDAPTSTVPVRVEIGSDVYSCTIRFDTGAKRWRFKDPGASVPVGHVPPDPGPDDDPTSTDGPVAHRVIRTGAIYRGDPHPQLQVTAIDARSWREVWERDWQSAFGTTVPEVAYPERMVVTFSGFVGDGIGSVRFERSGNDLVGHVVIKPYASPGGYQPSMRIFGAFEVPRVIGRVMYRTQIEGDEKVYESDCQRWQAGW
jgi:hypothetical protein